MGFVSIPFKRESSSEHGAPAQENPSVVIEFQFPSNGKVVPNEINHIDTGGGDYKVSIPFKRESSSEQREIALE